MNADGTDDLLGNNYFYYPEPPCPAGRSVDACNFTEPHSERNNHFYYPAPPVPADKSVDACNFTEPHSGRNNPFHYPAPRFPADKSVDACNFTEPILKGTITSITRHHRAQQIGLSDACNFTKPHSERQPHADRVPRNRSAMAKWDLHTEEVFVTICHDYHIQGQLLSTTFTETTWKEIQGKLLLETQTHYEVQQLKSKFCRLRQEWKKFKEIMNSKTGDGFCWDPATSTLIAPNEFWDEWLAAHPNDGNYRRKQFPCFDLCSELFSSSVATGKYATMSTGRIFSTQDGNVTGMQQVHRPGKEAANLRTSLYYSKGFVGNGVPGSRDGAKILPVKKAKVDPATRAAKVDSAIDSWKIVNTARAENLALKKDRDKKIGACIEVLDKMDGLAGHLYLKACDALMAPDRRVMFLAWSDDNRRMWVESLGTL